jgi:hypothetical protein
MRWKCALWLAACALAGCLDDHARPLDEFQASLPDAEGSGPDFGVQPDMGPQPCSDPGFLPPKHVRFVNQATLTLTLLWVDPMCLEHEWASLMPAGALEQDTFVGHVWRTRDPRSHHRVQDVRVTDQTPDVVVLEGPQ